MSHALEAIENALLDELPSTVEMIRLADLTIRENVESGQWDQACRRSMALVDVLKDRRTFGGAISRQRMDSSVADAGHATFQRCSDMSTHLLGLLAKHLPIYQRIVAGLVAESSLGAVGRVTASDNRRRHAVLPAAFGKRQTLMCIGPD